MLTVLAHGGRPLAPHDLAGASAPDPLAVLALVTAAVLYRRGRRRRPQYRHRDRAFASGLLSLAVALLSPLEAMSAALASAHMIQHLLLVAVAAPLLAWSVPGASMIRGLPPQLRRRLRGSGRRLRPPSSVRGATFRWCAYVAALWVWHSSALYDAAVANPSLHIAEHLLLIATAFLVWSTIVGPPRVRATAPAAALMLFTLGLQGVVLAALLTFSSTPWYRSYGASAPLWGLDPLTDQHLAGAIMWVPGGLAHVVVAVAAILSWLRSMDAGTAAVSAPLPSGDAAAAGIVGPLGTNPGDRPPLEGPWTNDTTSRRITPTEERSEPSTRSPSRGSP